MELAQCAHHWPQDRTHDQRQQDGQDAGPELSDDVEQQVTRGHHDQESQAPAGEPADGGADDLSAIANFRAQAFVLPQFLLQGFIVWIQIVGLHGLAFGGFIHGKTMLGVGAIVGAIAIYPSRDGGRFRRIAAEGGAIWGLWKRQRCLGI